MLTHIKSLAADPKFVSSVAFSPDGKLLATAGEMAGVVKLWEVNKWKEKAQLRTLGAGIRNVRFLPGGTQLLAGACGTTWLFDVRKRDLINYYETGDCRAIPLPASGQFLSYGAGGRLRLWDIASQQPVRESKKYKTWGGPLDVSADGRYCAFGNGTAISIWDLESWQEVHRLLGHKKEVRALAFSPDGGRLVSGAADRRLLVWDPATGGQVGEVGLDKRQQVWSLAFARPDVLASATGDGSRESGKVAVWDIASPRLIAETTQHETPIGIAALAGGSLIAAAYGHGGQVGIWRY